MFKADMRVVAVPRADRDPEQTFGSWGRSSDGLVGRGYNDRLRSTTVAKCLRTGLVQESIRTASLPV